MKSLIVGTGLLLSLSCLSLPVCATDDPDTSPPATHSTLDTVDSIAKLLGVPSLVLGWSYDQGTFKMWNSAGKMQLTDNGRSTPVLEYMSPEHILARYPMRYGNAVWGFNITGTLGQQHTTYQNVPGGSGIIGQNTGTSVNGDYLAVAPFVYLRLGPIYPDSDSYWLFGYGLGGALWHFSGNSIFYTAQPDGSFQGALMPVNSSSKFYIYQTWRWQFHFGNFDIRFEGRMLDHHKINGYNTSYENYGIGIAYTIYF